MKKIIALCFLTGIFQQSRAQTADTVKVIVNGQAASINNPETGRKTTITFEDSTNIFQVSIIKLSKKNWPVAKDNQDPKFFEQPKKPRNTRWLGEVSTGISAGLFANYSLDSLSFHHGETYYNIPNKGTAQALKIQSIIPSPGFRFELYIKEKRRKLNNKGMNLITGYRFQFNYNTLTGYGINNTYKTDSANRIQYDSFVSGYTTRFTIKAGNIKFCLPVLIEKQFKLKKRALSIQGGILAGLNNNFTSFDVVGISGFSMESEGSPQITIQPTLRVLFNNKVSFNLTYDLHRTSFSLEGIQLYSSRQLCFAVGYQFY